MEQVEAAPPLTAKPREYQPVPTADINANYPVSLHAANSYSYNNKSAKINNHVHIHNLFMDMILLFSFAPGNLMFLLKSNQLQRLCMP